MTEAKIVSRSSQAHDSSSQQLGRRERNKIEKRARIVAAARKLFAEQGFAETTTVQIAEAADIGTGTLFLYAKSKEDLLLLVFKDEMLEVAFDSFKTSHAEHSSVDRIMAVFEHMIDYHAKDIELSRILLRELVIPFDNARQSEIDELVTVIFAGLEQLIREGQVKGEILERLEPAATAQSCFALYYFGLLRWLSNRVSRENLLKETKDQILAFCRAR
jgi:AcrR family transcriptional regulator